MATGPGGATWPPHSLPASGDSSADLPYSNGMPPVSKYFAHFCLFAFCTVSPALAGMSQQEIENIKYLDDLVIPNPKDPESLLTAQPGAACALMREAASTGNEDKNFTYIVDPEFLYEAEYEGVERPALFEMKPRFWDCNVMEGDLEVICDVREFRNAAPAEVSKRHDELQTLVKQCLTVTPLGYVQHSDIWRRGETFATDGKVNAIVGLTAPSRPFKDLIYQRLFLTFTISGKR